MPMIHQTGSVQETKLLAQQVLYNMGGRNLICLYGDLGAGKTAFVSGMGQILGLTNIISPTFILIRKHSIKSIVAGVNFKILWHVDLYRLQTLSEVLDLGLSDLWSDQSNLVVIEWPEMIEHLLPKKRVEVRIKSLGPDGRELQIDYR